MADAREPDGRIDLRLFGSAGVMHGSSDATPALVARPKLLGLLAYLSLNATGGFIRRDKLVGIFWPEDDAEHARSSLRTALHRLRGILGDNWIRARGSEEIGLDPGQVRCDVLEFLERVRGSDCAGALLLFRGDFLDAFHVDSSPEFGSWLDENRAALRDRAAACARKLSAATLAASDFSGALEWSRRELAINPSDEAALRNLLRAHAGLGNNAAAIRAYEQFAQRYESELGIKVSAETRELAERIRRGDFSVGTARAIGHDAGLEKASDVSGGASGAVTSPVSGTPEPAGRARRIYIAVSLAAVGVAAVVLFANAWKGSAAARSPEWIRADLTASPLPRSHHTLVYDPQSRQAILFGGASEDAILGDVWRLSLAPDGSAQTWQRIRAESPEPVRRWLHFAAYDPGDDTMIVFAGAAGHTSPCLADVWILDNAMHGAAPLRWRKIEVPGPAPAPRAEFGAFYDAVNNRIMVQGGHDCIAPVFPDLWVLPLGHPTLARWTRLNPAGPQGAPHPLRSQVMAYDAENNRAIVFGGMDGRFPYDAVAVSDLWILSNANGLGGQPQWIRPPFRGPPIPATSKAMGAYDPGTNRLIVYGGYHNSGRDSEPTADVWVLEGANGRAPHANWRKLKLRGSTPGPRVAGAVAFDPNTERLILFGGSSKGKNLGDLWFLTEATGAR